MEATWWKSSTCSSWALPFIPPQGQRSKRSHDNLQTRSPLHRTRMLSPSERCYDTPGGGIFAKSARFECAHGRCDGDDRIQAQFWNIYCSLVQKSFFFLPIWLSVSTFLTLLLPIIPPCIVFVFNFSLSPISSHSPSVPSFPIPQPFISK